MNTEALEGDETMYPEPDARIIVAVLPPTPMLSTLKVTVAELEPAGIVT
jgi:hypothetical protein